MLNCMKVKCNNNLVVMTREELALATAPVSDPLLPLTVENLPWDDDTRLENETYVHRYVSNTRAPSYYRMRAVALNQISVWKLQKFLEDLQTQKQYTVGEMERLLDLERRENGIEYPRWKSILINAGLPPLIPKLPKVYELTAGQIMAEVTSVTDTLNDIGNRIRDTNLVRKHTDNVEPVDATEADVSDDFGYRLKLPFKMLYQAHIDILVQHGQCDNSYIQLMKLGEHEEFDEIQPKKHQVDHVEVQHPVDQIIQVKKKSNYWKRLQNSKIKAKLRQCTLKRKSENRASEVPQQRVHILETTKDEVDNTHCGDIICVGKITEQQISGADVKPQREETTEAMKPVGDMSDVSDACGSDLSSSEADEATCNDVYKVCKTDIDVDDTITGDLPDTKRGKKKKKRGVVRRMTAPLRWLRKRLI